MKISLEEVQNVLEQSKFEPTKIKEVIKQLEVIAEENKNEPKEPKSKNQFVVISFKGTESALVAQLPLDDDAGTALDRIKSSIREYNNSKKGKKKPCQNLGDSASIIKRAIFKNNNIHLKTKYPVRVIESDNSII